MVYFAIVSVIATLTKLGRHAGLLPAAHYHSSYFLQRCIRPTVLLQQQLQCRETDFTSLTYDVLPLLSVVKYIP